MILKRSFFRQETIVVAKKLLGTFLVHESKNGTTIGKIVETESYLGSLDPASHGFRGITKANSAMFKEAGHAYIYFTYGMYYCLNVVTAPEGVGEAVLIRALEPVCGIELMKERRKIDDLKNLCNGPAKLVIALGITKDLYGTNLTKKPLYILSQDHFKNVNLQKLEVITTTRVGISKAQDLPLRFYIKGNKYVSTP